MPGKPATAKETLVLIGVGLLAMLGAAFGIFKAIGQPVDGAAVLAERFDFTELPLDLEVIEAHELASADRMVRLERKASSQLDGSLPDRVIVLNHNKARAAKLLFPPDGKGIEAEKLRKWKADPAEVFKGEITRGRVAWGQWETAYIRERMFRDTGKWVDSMRVNLSTTQVNCVVFAEFPPEMDGTEEGLIELLLGLNPR